MLIYSNLQQRNPTATALTDILAQLIVDVRQASKQSPNDEFHLVREAYRKVQKALAGFNYPFDLSAGKRENGNPHLYIAFGLLEKEASRFKLELIARVITDSPHFREVDLSGTYLYPEEALFFISQLKGSAVNRLTLNNNPLDALDFADALPSALHQAPNIKNLNLKGIKITNEWVEHFAVAAQGLNLDLHIQLDDGISYSVAASLNKAVRDSQPQRTAYALK